MPCRKNMTGCRPSCGHRTMVETYQLLRIEWEQSLEAYANGYATEEAEFRQMHPPPTFRDWLEQHSVAMTAPPCLAASIPPAAHTSQNDHPAAA